MGWATQQEAGVQEEDPAEAYQATSPSMSEVEYE